MSQLAPLLKFGAAPRKPACTSAAATVARPCAAARPSQPEQVQPRSRRAGARPSVWLSGCAKRRCLFARRVSAQGERRRYCPSCASPRDNRAGAPAHTQRVGGPIAHTR
jgi:hypothetical protein